jgi:hypothetical protein
MGLDCQALAAVSIKGPRVGDKEQPITIRFNNRLDNPLPAQQKPKNKKKEKSHFFFFSVSVANSSLRLSHSTWEILLDGSNSSPLCHSASMRRSSSFVPLFFQFPNVVIHSGERKKKKISV